MFTLRTPLLLIAMLFLFSYGCKDCPPCDHSQAPEGYRLVKISDNTSSLISLPEAEAWTAAWRAKLSGANSGFLGTNPLKAFTIPHQDIAGVITSDSARAYLGILDTLGEINYHLIMVGVQPNGQDDLSKIYDLTLPCPDACDDRSPLN